MILFTILLIALATVATIMLVTAGAVGTTIFVVFGDVIVFAGIIWLIVKLCKKKK